MRIPQEAIDDVVRQIAEKFKPNKIILFGSYAYGNPTQISDVDLLVVMDSAIKENQVSAAIRKAINYHFGLDIIVKTPKSLSSRIEMGDFFLKEILQKGKVLYEHAAR
ncbi:MAG: nucleotidyltransferase domain-containing protein [Chloroflexi bacterium]|nr:nucleotidyltransferase domain-containing protein [Chloroflexota bacterium]